MTKREQLRYNVIQQLKIKVEKLDDRGLANYIDALPDCSPCIFDSRKCNDYCSERIFNYLLNHGDEEASKKMTNREWLATLTDEEFAKWNFEIGCGMCAHNPEKGMCDNLRGIDALIDEDSCIDGIAKWLQAEHKDGEL